MSLEFAASEHLGRALLDQMKTVIPGQPAESQWLTYAFGERVAAEATELPNSLFIQLYGDVLCYGPAAQQIYDFYDQVVFGFENGMADDIWGSLHKVYESLDLQNEDSVERDLKQWAWSEGSQEFLYKKLYEVAWRTIEFTGYRWACLMVTLFLNGQYLFPDDIKEKGQTTALRVSSALTLLGIEPLQCYPIGESDA